MSRARLGCFGIQDQTVFSCAPATYHQHRFRLATMSSLICISSALHPQHFSQTKTTVQHLSCTHRKKERNKGFTDRSTKVIPNSLYCPKQNSLGLSVPLASVTRPGYLTVHLRSWWREKNQHLYHDESSHAILFLHFHPMAGVVEAIADGKKDSFAVRKG